MNTITLSVEIGADRRLVIDLPDDVPLGAAQITITPAEPAEPPADAFANAENPARERLRAKLAAAGMLSTTWHGLVPEGFVRPSDEELLRLMDNGIPRPSIDQLIDEERGPH